MSADFNLVEFYQRYNISKQQVIAGTDEVGRGPLAGPVVAAAVILDANHNIEGLTDSKKLSEKKREHLEAIIKQQAKCFAIVEISAEEIDQLNILQASLKAMAMAAQQLAIQPDIVLVDGNKKPEFAFNCQCHAIIGGDLLVDCISAASILAKQYRDRLMVAYEAQYPGYGLAKHKGYPTKMHREAVEQLGPTPIHRRSFGPVARAILKRQMETETSDLVA